MSNIMVILILLFISIFNSGHVLKQGEITDYNGNTNFSLYLNTEYNFIGIIDSLESLFGVGKYELYSVFWNDINYQEWYSKPFSIRLAIGRKDQNKKYFLHFTLISGMDDLLDPNSESFNIINNDLQDIIDTNLDVLKMKAVNSKEVSDLYEKISVESNQYRKAEVVYKPSLNYPNEAKKAKIEGLVVVSMQVMEDGSITDIEILKGSHEILNNAAIEYVKKLKFRPAEKNGKPVASNFNFPVNFKLSR